MTTSISNPTGTTTVDLREPGQLLAATPHLLGFRPVDSVLAIGHRGGQGGRIGMVLRADLPPPRDEPDLAARLLGPLAGDVSVGASLVVVGGENRDPAGDLPHRALVEAVETVFADAGVTITHALWVPEIRAGVGWRCYQDSTCRGRLPDPDHTVMAAVAAHAGVVTFSSREAMEHQLAPADPAALERRAALLAAATDDTRPNWSRDHATEHGLAVVRAALHRGWRGEDVTLSDDEAVELALALSVPSVRDPCLATALPPGSAAAAGAERLWLEVVRAVPAPERAQPATLLAYSAYVRGEGALAGMALANAREADPGHVLAGLLTQALEHALPPRTLVELGRSYDDGTLAAPPELANAPEVRADGRG